MLRLILVPVAYAMSLVLFHLALRRSGPAPRSSRNVRGLVAGAVTLLFFLFINTINLCPPAWCGHYGFPVPYRAWSDAQVILNGVNLGIRPFTRSALLIDAGFAALVTLGVSLWFRRRSVANL